MALIAACASYTGEVVSWLAEKDYLSVPEEEVMAELSKLGAPSIVSARSAAMKKVRGSKKSDGGESNVREKPEIQLPFCGVIEDSWCKGIRYNHGLYTQCTKGMIDGGKYCKTCLKSAKNSASGKPTYGDISDRTECELLDFRDPKGKQVQCYANVAMKLGLDMDKAKAEAEKFGWSIPEDQLTVKVVKRGRPAKKVAKVVKPKGKRGRPAKVVEETKNSMDDQIAQLVAEAAEDIVGERNSNKKVVRKTAEEKAAEKAAKEAEKEAKKAAKKAAKEAKKAAKEAEKVAKKAAKEAEKAAKKAAKEAKKTPTKTEIKKKQLQKDAADIGCEISDETLATLKIGEIRQLIKEHKATVKAQAKQAKAVSSKKVTHTLMGECTVKAITTFQGGSVSTVIPVSDSCESKAVEEATELEAELVVDEEPVVDSSDEEEDYDTIEIDENTETVTVDGVEYYKINYGGYENTLITMEGERVGVLNSDNTISEFDDE